MALRSYDHTSDSQDIDNGNTGFHYTKCIDLAEDLVSSVLESTAQWTTYLHDFDLILETKHPTIPSVVCFP